MSKLIKQLREDKSVDLLYDSDEENQKVFKFDLIQKKASQKMGEKFYLTKSEFEAFKLFCFHSGQVFSKERLYELIVE